MDSARAYTIDNVAHSRSVFKGLYVRSKSIPQWRKRMGFSPLELDCLTQLSTIRNQSLKWPILQYTETFPSQDLYPTRHV